MRIKAKDPRLVSLMGEFMRIYLPGVRNRDKDTIDSYRYSINLFVTYLESEQKVTVLTMQSSDFSQKNIVEFMAWLKSERNNVAPTINHRLSDLRGFCKYLYKKNAISLDAYEAIRALSVVDDDRIAVLPEGMSLDYGAMIEPVAVAAHATMRGGDLKGKNVVVSGAGTIGNLVAQFAKARGAKRVLITDVSDFRLEIARKCGIVDTLNVAKTPLKEGAKRLFGDEDFQAAFEVAGVESSIRSLMECIGKGSTIVVVAVFGKDPSLNMFYLGEHELKVNGTMMYRHEDYLTAIDQVSSGAIRLEPLISNHFPFEQYDEAYKFIDENGATSMKIIIKL